ncbi:MAG: family 20 glycosylhydrolase [Bacteroidetes bacterium]|nr:family 20 glycosylhydrolase [Bacteroidota bacterium]
MRKIVFCFVVAGMFAGCSQHRTVGIPALIPVPVTLEDGEGSFKLNRQTRIALNAEDEEQVELAVYFNEQLEEVLGYTLGRAEKAGKNVISLEAPYSGSSQFSDISHQEEPELYQLDVETDKIRIAASAPAGLFYGIQTLMQLIPIADKHKMAGDEIFLPVLHIEDYPRFQWRGLMLDVSRHFFTIDEVKAYIDQMAKYKFNVFHWHLTDDQGWRVEISSLPKLTEVGAWRVPRTGPWWTYEQPQKGEEATVGGFYTKEEIKEVIQYAADRYIQVLPEIDVPGHSLAMIAAYPQLSSTELPYQVNPGSKFYMIEDNALNPAKEEVYEVMDKVFTEIAELFPFEYIHIGGDECYKGFWKNDPYCKALMKKEGLIHVNQLQSYFIKRLETILMAKGKKLIGWDEILEGGLAPEATVMSWRGMKGGITAAEMGHKVVMTPTTHCYLDLYQGDPQVEPITYSMLRLNDVYRFEPVPDGIDERLVLGGQGNLWTESVYTLGHAQYMTWPRGFALAEVLWSEKDDQEWENFVERSQEHFRRLDVQDVNYALSVFDPIINLQSSQIRQGVKKYNVIMKTEVKGLEIHYSFDDSFPDDHYPVYTEPVPVPEGAIALRVVTYRKGIQMGKQMRLELSKIRKE